MYRSGVRPSVSPSVCPVDRQQQRHAASLLLSAGAGRSIAVGTVYQSSIDISCRRPRSAANAGSVMLRADGRGSTASTCSPCFISLRQSSPKPVVVIHHCVLFGIACKRLFVFSLISRHMADV